MYEVIHAQTGPSDKRVGEEISTTRKFTKKQTKRDNKKWRNWTKTIEQ